MLEPEEANVGWNWEDLFSYMKKVCLQLRSLVCMGSGLMIAQAEGFSAPNTQQRARGAASVASYHGTQGPVQVTYPNVMPGGPQQKAFIDTVVNLTGIAHSKDLNGRDSNGVSITPLVRDLTHAHATMSEGY